MRAENRACAKQLGIEPDARAENEQAAFACHSARLAACAGHEKDRGCSHNLTWSELMTHLVW